ncbi:hypothetical protein PHPALM_27700 [Phytophthora palmivora]|uniref:Uncharacterized protein n=1 Tax=Phytophthora palmivora TaxID=4796 RepID=A0A2P4XBX9_9STRA|nr:hypothetical protein PHPALM_27700 [Phytophthora palmivora]
MLSKELNLNWEWCFAHMAHTATKASCGVNGAASAAENPEMADLVARIARTIFQIKRVSTMGNLFEELCKSKAKGASSRLVGYSTSRFLSLTNVLESILLKWPAITAWYEERARQALRAGKSPPEFPLANRYDDLEHVEVLVKLFLARIEDLNPDHALPHYKSTDDNPRWIAASDLTPLAAKTRLLLREALDERFFSRYYKDEKFKKSSFVMEMQLKLHPIYKYTERSLDRVVISSCRQHGKSGKEAVERKMLLIQKFEVIYWSYSLRSLSL